MLDQITHLHIFQGNQVVRRDKHVRLFTGEIFTLPLDFEVLSGQRNARDATLMSVTAVSCRSPVREYEAEEVWVAESSRILLHNSSVAADTYCAWYGGGPHD